MNHIYNIQLFIIFAFPPHDNLGQSIVECNTKNPYGLSIGYWGLNDLGFQVGLEINHLQTEKHRNYSYLSMLANRKADVYSSLGLRVGNSFIRMFKSGFYLEYGLFMGYLGSIYDFEQYGLNDNGEIVNIGRPWFHSALAGFVIGGGYDFSIHTNLNARVFIKPNIFYRLPNNDSMPFINSFLIEMGCTFDLDRIKNK
ncbi:hypothetical protein [Aquiflexum sp.]|uniref:hypothetical protein n=1 Tax=Aquiflexum sp. TaxID=1872584 RepID=UPI0035937A46